MPLSFPMPASWPSLLQPLFKCSAIRLLNLLILCQPLDPFCFLCQPPTHSVPFPAYFISQFCSSASLPYLLFPRSASYPLGFLCQLLTPFCCSASLLLFLFLCQPPALSVTSASFLPLLSHIRASYPFMLPLPASYPFCPLCEPPTLFYYLCQPPTCSVSSASLLPLLLPLQSLLPLLSPVPASYPFCPLCQPPTTFFCYLCVVSHSGWWIYWEKSAWIMQQNMLDAYLSRNPFSTPTPPPYPLSSPSPSTHYKCYIWNFKLCNNGTCI